MLSTRFAANKYLVVKHWNRIIVDIRNLQLMPTTMEVIALASDLSSDLPRSARIALVVRPDQVKDAKLVERIARIEAVFLANFLNPDEAALWVKQSTGNGPTLPVVTE
jgi:hypothetical protein